MQRMMAAFKGHKRTQGGRKCKKRKTKYKGPRKKPNKYTIEFKLELAQKGNHQESRSKLLCRISPWQRTPPIYQKRLLQLEGWLSVALGNVQSIPAWEEWQSLTSNFIDSNSSDTAQFRKRFNDFQSRSALVNKFTQAINCLPEIGRIKFI